MMFTFKIAEMMPLLRHTLKCRKHRKLYGVKDTDVPGLWLVHDEGVYLMSNGEPILRIKDKREKDRQQVVYALGWGPETRLGGDDFVELIRADWLGGILRQAEAKDRDTFSIELTETKIKLTV